MSDTHAVYAVLDTIHGPHKVRVSDHLTGQTPWDVFYMLEEDPRETQLRRDRCGRYVKRRRNLVYPGYECYGRPVRFFAVRATDDPNWPADRPVLSIRSTI